jgi:GntR family transcriptional repressor for pyruvate dehydrogenase complex
VTEQPPRPTWTAADTQLETFGHRRRRPKASDAVARAIVDTIVDNNLPPGAKLPSEAAMLQQYRVARATLREALRVLEVLGIVQMRSGPGGGPMVMDAGVDEFGGVATAFFNVTRATYRDLVEARLAVEPLLARLAAQRSDHAELAAALARTVPDTPDAELDDEQWAADAKQFHIRLMALSGNPIIGLLAGALEAVWFDRIVGTEFPASERARVHDDHTEIATAIAAGDAVRADELMRDHMQRFLDYSIVRDPGMLDEVIVW